MPENTYPTPVARWLVFATVLVADVLDLLSTTVTNVATPTILKDLHAPDWVAPWLGASYALALGSTLVLGARLGDRHGARRVFVTGLAGFAVASGLCAWAPTAATIVTFRLVQGIFGALLIPQGFTLLLRVFPRSELGKVFALFGPLMAVSSISGPVLAALLITADPFGAGWRAVFGVNVLIGLVLFPIAWRTLPSLPADRTVRLDPIAVILLSAGLFGVLAALTLLQQPTTRHLSPVLVVLGAVALAGFTVQQSRSPHPLLAPTLFRRRSFIAGASVGIGFFAVTAGLLFATTLYLQLGRGLSVLPAAGITAATSVGIITASFTTRPHIATLGRTLLLAGLLLLAIGVGGYLVVVHYWPNRVWLLSLPLFLCGLGMGCGFGTVFAVALGEVDPAEAGSASGTLNGAQQIANAIGSALIATTYLSLAEHGTPVHALTACLVMVAGCIALSLLTLPLLPKQAADTH